MKKPCILVVGAGPTGLFFAHEMLKQGHHVRIIDRKAALSTESKALGVHARTLELLDQAGIAQDFIKKGRHGKGLTMYIHGHQGPKISFDNLPSPFPYLLLISQKWSEQILYDHLVAVGGHVEWNTELVSIEQGCCTLKTQGKENETFVPDWIIGADGSRSIVRTSMQSAFVGKGIDRTFVLLDIRGDITLDPYYLHGYVEAEEPCIFIPFPPDHYRIIFASQSPEQEKLETYTPAFIEQLISKRCGHSVGKIKHIDWISFFQIRTCLAESFHKNNCFLMGDAAHIHSPMGAQGMNMSLQDAYNLAWKLNLVIKKVASPILLESYEKERKSAIQKILKGTERGTEIGFALPRWARTVLFSFINLVALFPKAGRYLVYQISQLGVSYPHSPIVFQPAADKHWRGPRPGERAPYLLTQNRSLFSYFKHQKHTVLLFCPNSDISVYITKFAPWIDIQVIDDPQVRATYAADPESIYVIRPDGYIGFRSRKGSQADLEFFLSQTFPGIAQASPLLRM